MVRSGSGTNLPIERSERRHWRASKNVSSQSKQENAHVWQSSTGMWPQKQKVNVLEQFGWIRFAEENFSFPVAGSISLFSLPFLFSLKRSVLVCPLSLALSATMFPSRGSNIELFFYANWVCGVGGTHDFNEVQMFRHECKDAYCLWQVMRLSWRKTGERVLSRPGLLISKVCVGVGPARPHCFWKIIQEEAFWRRVYR